ncbi:hypothetical protein [Amaricoccus macauensis]
MPILGNIDAYQNLRTGGMIDLGHSVLRTLFGVACKTTMET